MEAETGTEWVRTGQRYCKAHECYRALQAPVCRHLHSDATLWPCVPGSPLMLLGRLLQMPPNAPGCLRIQFATDPALSSPPV
jgi:hypothetical protein